MLDTQSFKLDGYLLVRGLVDANWFSRLKHEEPRFSGTSIPIRAGDALVFGGLLLHRSLPEVRLVNDGNKLVLQDGFSWMVAGGAP